MSTPLLSTLRSALALATIAIAPLTAHALTPLANLGQKIFSDPFLSASGQLACATCHAPQNAMMATNNQPVQLGGAAMNLQGFRSVPSVTYARFTPRASPTGGTLLGGGLQLDGRATDLQAQAVMPFTAANEMANQTTAEVQRRLVGRPYVATFQSIFGAGVLKDADATVRALGQAIAAYEQEGSEFQRFNSKYDAVVAGRASFTAREANGEALFNSPSKGNCAVCHTGRGPLSSKELFSNFSYQAVAVPRNWKISYNLDNLSQPSFVPANGSSLGAPNHRYYDLGVCGPFRTDLTSRTDTCGKFKVPGLRNVALKGALEHNGVFTNLLQVVDFYNTRDAQPGKWYKKADGVTPDIAYNDLPVIYQGNENRRPPFQPLLGNQPRLTPAEMRDIVLFMCALTDGYDPANPAAYPYPAQCQAAAK